MCVFVSPKKKDNNYYFILTYFSLFIFIYKKIRLIKLVKIKY